jgi:hypothetical protein
MNENRPFHWTRILALLVAFLLIPVTVSASSQIHKRWLIDPGLLQILEEEEQSTFWVILAAQPELREAVSVSDWKTRGEMVVNELKATSLTSQAGARAVLARHGASYKSFWIVNTIKVTGSKALMYELATLPGVARIIPDGAFEIPAPAPGKPQPQVNNVEWNIDRINAPQVWAEFGVRGEGIVVANIDTGVQFDHPAVAAQYRGNLGGGSYDHNYNWYDPSNICGNPSLVPCDNEGHGTHTMGTMVGDDGAGNQIGVAPGARWIAAKGCETNSCSYDALLSTGQWVLAPTDLNGNNPRPDLRPNVVNNSWGGGGGDPFYQTILQNWVAAGIFPAFSIGNAGSGCNSAGSPGDYPESYAAGAFDINNWIAWFSSRGPSAFGITKPNLSAPGVDVRSSVPYNGYAYNSGTSMASPHVAGTVVLMWSAAPSLIGNIDATRALLDQTAIEVVDYQCNPYPYPGPGEPNNVWGEGRIDAYQAVLISPRGPVGVLQGTVTDAATNLPIENASVSATGPTNRQDYTDPAGVYQFQYMPEGSYEVTAGAFGYLSQTAVGVAVVADTVTVQDFALQPAPAHMLSGFVRDDSGVAVPNAMVTILNTPIPAAVTDAAGYYAFPSVPEGSYEVHAAAGGCNSPQTQFVDLASDVSLDFTLPVVEDAAGYRCQIIPLDWTDANTDTGLSGDDSAVELSLPFTFSFYGQRYNRAFVATNGFLNFWGWNARYANNPIPDFSEPHSAIYALWDDLYVDYWMGDRVKVDTFGVAPDRVWVVEYENVRPLYDYSYQFNYEIKLFERTGVIELHYLSMPGPGDGRNATVGIENPDSTIALQYSSDQAVLRDGLAIRFIPPPSAVIEGVVTDANTGLGVEGATVRAFTNGSLYLTANTDADGYYSMWLRLGDYTLEASKAGYVTETAALSLHTPDLIVTQNFTLRSPLPEVTPVALDFLVPADSSRTLTLDLRNLGTADLTWELRESGGGMATTSSTMSLQRNSSFEANARTTKGLFVNAETPGWSPTAPGNVLRSWPPTGLDLAWGVGYQGNVWLSDVLEFGNACAYYGACRNVEFNPFGSPTGRAWGASWPGVWHGDMAYDSTHNLMCQVNVGGDNGIYCWDVNTGNLVDFITGPWAWISQRGLAYRPDDDSFYIGGWNEGVIYHVQGLSGPNPGAVIDQCWPPDGSISGLAWNPAFNILWEATNSYMDTIYELNPETCNVLATLPHPTPYYNGAGLEMDNEGNLWMISQYPNTVYLVDSGVPAFVDVPWLSESPESGVLAPDQSQQIQVTVDTSGMSAGVYQATLFLRSNSPTQPTIRIPVNLIVPAYMKLANAGGQAYTDLNGYGWLADQMYSSGSWGYVNRTTTARTNKPISGTLEDPLYQDQRVNILEYRFDGLPAGIYQVELLFAEVKQTQPGKRMYDVLIEGNMVLYAHDTALEVGSFAADDHIFYLPVTDGQLNIRFVPKRSYGSPIINAVAVIQRPDR